MLHSLFVVGSKPRLYLSFNIFHFYGNTTELPLLALFETIRAHFLLHFKTSKRQLITLIQKRKQICRKQNLKMKLTKSLTSLIQD